MVDQRDQWALFIREGDAGPPSVLPMPDRDTAYMEHREYNRRLRSGGFVATVRNGTLFGPMTYVSNQEVLMIRRLWTEFKAVEASRCDA